MFSTLLAQRAAENRPVRVGIIGTGKFGAGLVAQISQMRGMVTSVIADIKPENAIHAYTSSGIPRAALLTGETAGDIDAAIRLGQPIVVEDGAQVAAAEQIDVIVEATGVPEVGAAMAYHAISARKHVVMVNVEADVTVGPLLRRLAGSAGVVYTLVDGDQPGCTMNMIEWARTLGFEIVAAGRGTVYYADDRSGTPDTVPQRFGFDEETLKRRTINLKMYNSFRDGTKAQVEMAALANAAGLEPDVRGMHEPSVNIQDIATVCSLRSEGGILSRHGVVELANSVAGDGKTLLPNGLGMGVFAVIRTEHPFTQEDLRAYFLHAGGNGHNYLLYRPYHLVAVEAPISIAMAALYNQATGAPLPQPMAEVITVAKRDLKQGETIDGGGGYTVNGICEKASVARAENLLPLGLANGARLRQDVAQGTAIAYSMVELVEDSFILKLRRLQDATA
jgi:predicted homoserine dehydrogenase-like protein